MYTLILTLLSYRSSAITTVPGFRDLPTCLAAGNSWIKQMREPAQSTNIGPRALCIRVS